MPDERRQFMGDHRSEEKETWNKWTDGTVQSEGTRRDRSQRLDRRRNWLGETLNWVRRDGNGETLISSLKPSEIRFGGERRRGLGASRCFQPCVRSNG
ncbi:hypothetical protein Mapa_008587 [Marchantia paleacea]|nr:hypothetical protein Mapa_008587 [Marchantia paleacea]